MINFKLSVCFITTDSEYPAQSTFLARAKCRRTGVHRARREWFVLPVVITYVGGGGGKHTTEWK